MRVAAFRAKQVAGLIGRGSRRGAKGRVRTDDPKQMVHRQPPSRAVQRASAGQRKATGGREARSRQFRGGQRAYVSYWIVPDNFTVLVPAGLALLPSNLTVPVSVPVAPL